MTALALIKSPIVRWAVWIPGERRAASPTNPERIWSTSTYDAALARAELVNGNVVDLAWLVENLEKLRTGEVMP